jgi:hypothetical protein
MRIKAILTAALMIGMLNAQDAPVSQDATLRAILQRLDSLEKQNQELADEVHALREQLAATRTEPKASPADEGASQAPLNERVAVVERRVEEQSQTKVEASQRFPLSLTGMLLFNAFRNSYSQGTPDSYSLLDGPNESGATLRQTLLGVQFQGPSIPGGGKVSGNLMMDFYSGGVYPSDNWIRLRTADISFNWANRSFSVGQQKPLISPYNPDSLAEVGVPPLAGSGNLWLWLPQARYEERHHFGANNGLTGQVAILQTLETFATVPTAYMASLEHSRPALEGRLAFWHQGKGERRFEIAPGFHIGTSHFAGVSVDSRIASIDWLLKPSSRFQFSGTVFSGRNLANVGAIPEGFTVLPTGSVIPVHGRGGWFQASYLLTSRLTLNVFSGLQDNRGRDLVTGNTVRNLSYAGNLLYHLGPNVLLGFEALQLRSSLLSAHNQVHNHYDLSVAYLF